MKKTILIILITVVVTSLLWLVVAKASASDGESKYFVNYEQSIIGKWVSVEEADFDLEFTKYGIMKWRVGVFEDTFEAIDLDDKNNIFNSLATLFDDMLEIEMPYYVDGRVLHYKDIDTSEEIAAEIDIYVEEGVEYLEIYNITALAGKYRRIASSK
jgi:hypothetical protein